MNTTRFFPSMLASVGQSIGRDVRNMTINAQKTAYVTQLDAAAIDEAPKDKRYLQQLLFKTDSLPNGFYYRTPPGGGSRRGLHSHEWDQAFFVIEGRMGIEVDGKVMTVEKGDLGFIPAGAVHRQWNDSPDKAEMIHLELDLGETHAP